MSALLGALNKIFDEIFHDGNYNNVVVCYDIMTRIRDINTRDYIATTLIYILRYVYSTIPIESVLPKYTLPLTNLEIAISAMILGAKLAIDQPKCYNDQYAKEAGMSFSKVCLNEIIFYKKLNFDFSISTEEYIIALGIVDNLMRDSSDTGYIIS